MIREKRNIIIPTRYLSTSITQFHSSSFKKMSALIYDLCYKALGMVWNNAWRYITKETLVLPKERCSDLWHSWHRKLVLMKAPYDYLKSDKIFNHFLEKFLHQKRKFFLFFIFIFLLCIPPSILILLLHLRQATLETAFSNIPRSNSIKLKQLRLSPTESNRNFTLVCQLVLKTPFYFIP